MLLLSWQMVLSSQENNLLPQPILTICCTNKTYLLGQQIFFSVLIKKNWISSILTTVLLYLCSGPKFFEDMSESGNFEIHYLVILPLCSTLYSQNLVFHRLPASPCGFTASLGHLVLHDGLHFINVIALTFSTRDFLCLSFISCGGVINSTKVCVWRGSCEALSSIICSSSDSVNYCRACVLYLIIKSISNYFHVSIKYYFQLKTSNFNIF